MVFATEHEHEDMPEVRINTMSSNLSAIVRALSYHRPEQVRSFLKEIRDTANVWLAELDADKSDYIDG